MIESRPLGLAPALFVLIGCLLVAVSSAAQGKDAPPKFNDQELEFFEKTVRPILINRCYKCHGADSEGGAKGKLRLDARAAVLAGGESGQGAVAGDPGKSLIIDAINYGDYEMPPKSKLPRKEIDALTKWVKLGLPWPKGETAGGPAVREFDLEKRKAEHWCWQPVRRPQVPAVKQTDWPRQPIDYFLLAKLEEKRVAPGADADRRTLLRRIYFDLIGLPPTPAETHAFVNDKSPKAFETVVDRLLESPHFGERWGRHWLDLVRYAESRGHEFDYTTPNAYQYRDYVIRALNADVPYDQFVKEHVAGDLLSKPRLHPKEGYNESIIGTGFWFLGEWVHSPVDIRKDETDRFDNMIDVFGKTFMGITLGCARCHDHKFDAIGTADYYGMLGYLQSSAYRQVRFETMEHNRKIAEELTALREKTAESLRGKLGDALQASTDRFDDYLLAARDVLRSSNESAEARRRRMATAAKEKKLSPTRLASFVQIIEQATDDQSSPLHAWARLCSQTQPQTAEQLAALFAAEPEQDWKEGLDVIVDFAEVGKGGWMQDGYSFGPGPLQPGDVQFDLEGNSKLQGVAAYGAARRDPFWNGMKNAPGTHREAGRLAGWERAGRAVRTPTFEITKQNVYILMRGEARVLAVVDSHKMLNGPLHGSLMREIKADKPTWIGYGLGRYRKHGAHLEFIAKNDSPLEILAVVQADRPPSVMPMQTASSLHLDGDLRSEKSAAKAIAGRLRRSVEAFREDALRTSNAPAGAAYLADWMLKNPSSFLAADDAAEKLAAPILESYKKERDRLFASVRRGSKTVMAMWDGSGQDEYVLVRGNPRILGDRVPRGLPVAISGERKNLQATGSGRRKLAEDLVDPKNPLVARVMVNRVWHHLFGRGIVGSPDNFGVLGMRPTHPELLDHLAAEFVRDGWSVKRLIRSIVLSRAYQMSSAPNEKGDAVDPQNMLLHRMNIRRLQGEVIRDSLLAVSGRLDRKLFGPSVPVFLTPFMQGRGRPRGGPIDGAGRRSIYVAVRRNFLSPMMLAFDVPIPFNTIGRRNVSNVPAQALSLMNDPFVVDQAKRWSARALAEAKPDRESRIDWLYETGFARLPTKQERAAAEAFLQTQGKQYELPPEQMENDPRVWADLCHVLVNVKEFIFIR